MYADNKRASDVAGALKKNAKDIDNDLTEEEKQNLVKAGLGALAVVAVGIIAFVASKHDKSNVEKAEEYTRRTADNFPGRVWHTASKLADDVKVAAKEGGRDLKHGAGAAKDEAKSWFK